MREATEIRTKDGVCPASVFTPAGAGPWPAVIFFMDGLAIRPALFDMAQRIADEGYVVLLPDMFYRAGAYEPFVPKEVFAAANFRETLGRFFASTNTTLAAEDTAAFIAYLDTRNDVRKPKLGVVGFCMGGAMALTAAGRFPDRVAAAISFHGGNLATDADTSPHLLAPQMKGFVYVAGADQDNSYPPEMAARLEAALTAAGVRHRAEIYTGAKHGWTKPDFPVYDAAAAERAHAELRAIFARELA